MSSESLSRLSPSEYRELHKKVGSIKHFSLGFVGVRLRPYQVEAADAIVKSVLARDGNSFVLLFARQSGKDELIANVFLYLLARLAETGASMVCVQPTFRPQTLTAMDRLRDRAFQRPFFSLGGLHRTHGFVYEFLSARVSYLSADPSANVVGATADRLLIINEAQDIRPALYDRRFAPMAASGNATRVFSGTAWTGDTLLDREKRLALQREQQDGIRRAFIVDGGQVAHSNPFYARFLEGEIAHLGRDHPLVRTQYFCENIDARSRMFTPAHRALMQANAHLPFPFGSGSAGDGAQHDSAINTSPHLRSPENGNVSPERGVGGGPRTGAQGAGDGTSSKGLGEDSFLNTPLHFRSPENGDCEALTCPRKGEERSGWRGAGGGAPTVNSRPAVPTPSEILSCPRGIYAFLLDVAGQEESSMSYTSRALAGRFEPELNARNRTVRDAVTLRIVEVDLSTLETLQSPTYRAVHLQQWTGQNHLTVFGQLKALAERWRPQHIVIDATGVGEGLWAMLDKAFPTRVTGVKFTQQVKSELGYGFLAIINTGRFRDYCGFDPQPIPQGESGDTAGYCPTAEQIDKEYAGCECEVLIGPQRTMRWGVPEGRRDANGVSIHDDIPVTDSLTYILDRMKWTKRFKPFLIQGKDPLAEMSRFRWTPAMRV